LLLLAASEMSVDNSILFFHKQAVAANQLLILLRSSCTNTFLKKATGINK
jgi:hypothetical protein